MIKKIYTLLICATAAFTAAAQSIPGSWDVIPMSSPLFSKVLDTPDVVYYITGTSLYSYNKDSQETTYYSPGSNISGTGIQNIYYNPDGKYSVLVYSDSNIDILYPDGRVVNVPDIRDANLLTTKNINDVFFTPSRIYAATAFGFVVFDAKDFHVIESGIYDQPFNQIMEIDGYILATRGAVLYATAVNERHKDFSAWKQWTAPATFTDMMPLKSNPGEFLYIAGNDVNKGTINAAEKKIAGVVLSAGVRAGYFTPSATGILAPGSSALMEIAPDGTFTRTAMPGSISSSVYGSWQGPAKIWSANRQGIASYDISGAQPVTLSEPYMPQSSQLFGTYFFQPSKDGKSVYYTGVRYHRGATGGLTHCTAFNGNLHSLIERMDWDTKTFTRVNGWFDNGRSSFISSAGFAVDPVDPSIIYGSDFDHAMYVYKDGNLIAEFGPDNSPIDKVYFGWPYMHMLYFDPAGNLWVGERRNDNYVAGLHCIPADKLDKFRKDPSSLVASDWYSVPFDRNFGDSMSYYFIIGKKRPNLGLFMSDYSDLRAIVDTKGTVNTADDQIHYLQNVLTQDGNTVGSLVNTYMVEDLEGDIWIGTTEGIFVVKDLNESLGQSQLHVIRPKVARNDGTVYADYLLSTDVINGIAVDPLNRKWVSTEASGLFLVSADGTEILENFTNTNSPLPTNQIWGVYCNPNGNEVYVNTAAGSYIYNSTAAPAAEDYSEVYAYPNPVRPDYEGWITIQGLMDNSLVKIADAQGNVVAQGMSEGGMYVWDGCNAAGERVRSGVYMVLASQSSGESSSGAVTKIVVIN